MVFITIERFTAAYIPVYILYTHKQYLCVCNNIVHLNRLKP